MHIFSNNGPDRDTCLRTNANSICDKRTRPQEGCVSDSCTAAKNNARRDINSIPNFALMGNYGRVIEEHTIANTYTNINIAHGVEDTANPHSEIRSNVTGRMNKIGQISLKIDQLVYNLNLPNKVPVTQGNIKIRF